MAKKLYLTFEDSNIKTTCNLAIASPKEGLTREKVEEVAKGYNR